MRHSVSISLSDGIFKQLKEQSQKEHANWSEVTRKALSEYFFRSEFSRLHKKALVESAKKGIALSDEDIFNQVS